MKFLIYLELNDMRKMVFTFLLLFLFISFPKNGHAQLDSLLADTTVTWNYEYIDFNDDGAKDYIYTRVFDNGSILPQMILWGKPEIPKDYQNDEVCKKYTFIKYPDEEYLHSSFSILHFDTDINKDIVISFKYQEIDSVTIDSVSLDICLFGYSGLDTLEVIYLDSIAIDSTAQPIMQIDDSNYYTSFGIRDNISGMSCYLDGNFDLFNEPLLRSADVFANKELALNPKFRIYPNPARDNIYIQDLNEEQYEYEISILNEIGQKQDIILEGVSYMQRKKFIDVSQLPPGFYFLILSDNEKIFLTEKIIIK
jgi:Secretion system C-terminal sorting domain